MTCNFNKKKYIFNLHSDKYAFKKKNVDYFL